jgi:hypothetical protein
MIRVLECQLPSSAQPADTEAALDAVMDFAGWTKARLDEWLELVLSGSTDQASPHFASTENPLFVVRIRDVDDKLSGSQTSTLMRIVARVNQRAVARTGSPVLSLTFG